MDFFKKSIKFQKSKFPQIFKFQLLKAKESADNRRRFLVHVIDLSSFSPLRHFMALAKYVQLVSSMQSIFPGIGGSVYVVHMQPEWDIVLNFLKWLSAQRILHKIELVHEGSRLLEERIGEEELKQLYRVEDDGEDDGGVRRLPFYGTTGGEL